jgi:hypothetical protein
LPEIWTWVALDRLIVSGPQNKASLEPTKCDDFAAIEAKLSATAVLTAEDFAARA